MRIVGGRHRGRPLRAPGGRDSRPTAARARDAILHIRAHRLEHSELARASLARVFARTCSPARQPRARGPAPPAPWAPAPPGAGVTPRTSVSVGTVLIAWWSASPPNLNSIAIFVLWKRVSVWGIGIAQSRVTLCCEPKR